MFNKLNPILHAQLRLAIVSYLVGKGKSDFNELKQVTGATSGNLSVQLKKLEKEKYIVTRKGFLNNYQHTAVEITQKGLRAFEQYVSDLKDYLKP